MPMQGGAHVSALVAQPRERLLQELELGLGQRHAQPAGDDAAHGGERDKAGLGFAFARAQESTITSNITVTAAAHGVVKRMVNA